MKELTNYSVYRHTSPSGKTYIGITKRKVEDRWENGYAYKKHFIFWGAIKKYGWDNIFHEVLLENQTKSEAIYAEKYLIRWYKSCNMSYNITDGGDGVLGYAPWNKGLPCSNETKRKIGNANRGERSGWWHKVIPEEMRRKISEAKKGIATKTTVVFQYSLDDKFIKKWDSISNAARSLGIDESAIAKCCRGKRNKCGNYKWGYTYENKNYKDTKVA